MADRQTVLLTVKVNKETGALEAVNAELKGLDDAVERATKRALEASGTFAQLKKLFLEFGSSAAILAFFREAVREFEAEAEALRRLQAQLESAGQSFEANSERIREWGAVLQESSRFADDDLFNALGRAVQKTRDLEQAQKVVQLAMDVSVATGRDFNATLDLMATAAGGSSRGLSSLKTEFGALLTGVESTSRALEVIAARYRGAAEAEEGLTRQTAELRNAWSDLKEVVGSLLGPVLAALGTELANVIAKTKDWLNIRSQEKLRDQVEALKEQRQALIGSTAELSRHAVQTKETLAEEERRVKRLKELDAEIAKAEKELADAIKGTRVETRKFKVAESERELAEKRSEMDRRIALERELSQTELSVKNQTEEQRVQIVERSAQAQKQIVLDAFNSGVMNAEEARNRVEQIEAQRLQALLALNQKYVVDMTGQLQGWLAKNSQVDAQLLALGLSTADSLARGFGKSFADSITEGKSFSQSMQQLYKQMVNAIIAELARIAAARMLAGAIGAGVGIPVAPFAEGGRVDRPTLALLGEAGESETVVPDSKAEDFARGVLAGKGTGASRAMPAPAGAGAGPVSVTFGDVNVTVQTGDLSDPVVRDRIIRALSDEVKKELGGSIELAIRLRDLGTKYSGRAA